ncbi:hypothetical protein B0H12DRAFT_1142779 [Mycena haematopus]|nr:hypothetical protein B0H12DRAFT_1142779 [Mycena haematopus]
MDIGQNWKGAQSTPARGARGGFQTSDGLIGNYEVGHLNIGAGRVVCVRINHLYVLHKRRAYP